jgi:hypothetical protein
MVDSDRVPFARKRVIMMPLLPRYAIALLSSPCGSRSNGG